MLWRIICRTPDPLFWSNIDGWVEGDSNYTVFTEDEKERCRLPIDGQWVAAAEGDVATSPNRDPLEVAMEADEWSTFAVRCHLDLRVTAKDHIETQRLIDDFLAELATTLAQTQEGEAVEFVRVNQFGPTTLVIETAE